MRILKGPTDYPSGLQNVVVYVDDLGTLWWEYNEEDGSFHRFFSSNFEAAERFLEIEASNEDYDFRWQEVGPGTDFPDKEPMGHVQQGQSVPPLDAHEIPSGNMYDNIEVPPPFDAREAPSDDRYDRMEAPIINEFEERPPDPVMAAEEGDASQYGEVRGIPDWGISANLVNEAAAGQAPPTEDLEQERAEQMERSEREQNPPPPEAPPPPSEPSDPDGDRMPEEDSNPYGDVRMAPDWNDVPDLAEEPAPAPPTPDPSSVPDPALLDETAPGPTLDPNLFDAAAPGPTLDAGLFDPTAPGPTLDAGLFDPASPGATIDPALLDPAAPGETIAPAMLDPVAPGPTLDPATLEVGLPQESSITTPTDPMAGQDFADPVLAEPPATGGAVQDGGYEGF